MESFLGEQWSPRNIGRRLTCRKPIRKRKKPRIGFFPLPTGNIVPFKTYVHEMGETPDLLEARPPGWDENKEERRVNKKTRKALFDSITRASLAYFLFSYGYNQLSLMQNYLHESQFFMQIKYMPDYVNTYGHVQLLAKYGLAAVTAMFVPYLTRSFKDKWILFVTAGGYAIFISLGFLDAKYTIMPSGFIAGLCCMSFFITYQLYMVNLARRLGDLNKKRPYNGIQGNWLLLKFNSFSFSAWYFGYALACATSAVVFHGTLTRNNTYIHIYNLSCGASYCDQPWPNWWDVNMKQDNIPRIDNYTYANLANACCAILAMALFLFGCADGQTTKVWASLRDEKGFELNFKLGWKGIFNCNRTLLAPFFIFTGWSADFIAYSFTRAYIICSVESWILFIGLAEFGVFACITSSIVPWLALKKRAIRIMFVVAVLCYAVAIVGLIAWKPVASVAGYNNYTHKSPHLVDYVLFFIIPAVWGVGAGTFLAFITLKIEFEYPEEDDMLQMFALFHHWAAVGVLIGYATRNTATCTDAKLYSLLGTLILGVFGYILYERKRRKLPESVKFDDVKIEHFLPNPDPDNMANESDVEEEGTSTSEEEDDDDEGRTRRKIIKYKRPPPPNDPRLSKAWKTPYFPPDLEIPRKYITPDGHIMIMPRRCKPPFEVQDSFESNIMLDTDLDKVTAAARKACFQLGYGGEPLFFDVDALLEDERDALPCKFDAKGNVLPGMEDLPDWDEDHLASNPRHHVPERFDVVLERLRRKREMDVRLEEEQEQHRVRRRNTTNERDCLLEHEE